MRGKKDGTFQEQADSWRYEVKSLIFLPHLYGLMWYWDFIEVFNVCFQIIVVTANLYSDVAMLLGFFLFLVFTRYQAWWDYVWHMSTAANHWHPMEMCWMHELRLVHSLLSWGQASLKASFLQNYHTRKWKVKYNFLSPHPRKVNREQLIVVNFCNCRLGYWNLV